MKFLIFKDGSTKEITGDEGKYWICGEERFRKLGRMISEVQETAAKKKSARKKKEAATGGAENGECGK